MFAYYITHQLITTILNKPISLISAIVSMCLEMASTLFYFNVCKSVMSVPWLFDKNPQGFFVWFSRQGKVPFLNHMRFFLWFIFLQCDRKEARFSHITAHTHFTQILTEQNLTIPNVEYQFLSELKLGFFPSVCVQTEKSLSTWKTLLNQRSHGHVSILTGRYWEYDLIYVKRGNERKKNPCNNTTL